MAGMKEEVRPGAWRLRVYAGRRPNGTPIQVRKTVYGGVRLADTELAKMVAKASTGRLSASTTTVADVVNDYIVRCENKRLSPTTLREYRRLADKVVIPKLGHLRANQLRVKQLDKFYSELIGKGNSPATVRRVHALVSSSLKRAKKLGDVDQNVALDATLPDSDAVRVKAPTPAQVKRIIAAAEKDDPMLASILTLAALTGARRGELCALRWSDLNWKTQRLTIGRSVYELEDGGWAEKGTKTHAARDIGLDPVALEGLRRHRQRVDQLARRLGQKVPADGFMFSLSPIGSEPIRPDWLTRHATKAGGDAGVKMHLHELRHFAATQGFAAGFDPVAVSHRLGHRDPSVTLKVYSHAVEARDRDLAASLGERLSSS